MNENARMDPALNQANALPNDATLFGDSSDVRDELDEFLAEDSDELAEDPPRLTLRHPEEFEDSQCDVDADLVESQELPTADAPPTTGDENDNWPWDTDLAEIKARCAEPSDGYDDLEFDELDRMTRPTSARSESQAMHAVEDDQSAIEDVVLSMPIVQTPIEETLAGFVRKMDEATAASVQSTHAPLDVKHSEAAAAALADENVEPVGVDAQAENVEKQDAAPTVAVGAHTSALPKRIGDGRLVPARLTWRPGDPFGSTDGTGRRRFRWDVMLTSAGITAACGMACIWLLRTLLA